MSNKCKSSQFIKNLREYRELKMKNVFPLAGVFEKYRDECLDNFGYDPLFHNDDREEFLSKLRNTDISGDDYMHTQKVWKEFRLRNEREYRGLRMRVNVFN